VLQMTKYLHIIVQKDNKNKTGSTIFLMELFMFVWIQKCGLHLTEDYILLRVRDVFTLGESRSSFLHMKLMARPG
jgi:hypothetical protein